ncbi:hypothetical protein JKG47_00345 [Acidithiobacillus sp. MC6.1]|nr:hypothetical protein [Acidithiobacillus sp. MC6.1]
MEVRRLTIRLDNNKPDDLEILGFLTRLEERGHNRNLQLWLKRSLREGLRTVEHKVHMGRMVTGGCDNESQTSDHPPE